MVCQYVRNCKWALNIVQVKIGGLLFFMEVTCLDNTALLALCANNSEAPWAASVTGSVFWITIMISRYQLIHEYPVGLADLKQQLACNNRGLTDLSHKHNLKNMCCNRFADVSMQKFACMYSNKVLPGSRSWQSRGFAAIVADCCVLKQQNPCNSSQCDAYISYMSWIYYMWRL